MGASDGSDPKESVLVQIFISPKCFESPFRICQPRRQRQLTGQRRLKNLRQWSHAAVPEGAAKLFHEIATLPG